MLRLPFSGVKLAPCQVALVLMCAGCLAVCQPAAAQRGHTPAGGPPGGPQVAAEQEAGPADVEEGQPEKKYDSRPVDIGLKKEDSKIRAILREGKFADPQAKADFDAFYTDYFLSRWSLQGDVTKLIKYRQDLSSHFRTAIPGEVHDHLARLVLDFLTKLAGGDYHPAVRINAVLAIGELNSVEPSGHDAAVPLPEALDVLIAAVESKKLSDGLRAAAMVGILRHASAGISGGEAKKKVNDLMLRLATADVPAGSALSARAWMVAQAAETLGALGAVGEKNDAFTALLKIVADTKLPFLVRCAAADALGKLNYSSAGGINPVETAAALGQLAIDACKDGLETTKDTASVAFRRRMLRRLDAVLTALGGDDEKSPRGIQLLAKEPPQKTFVDGLQKVTKEAVEKLDYKLSEEEDMKDTVTTLQKQLEGLLQKKP